MTQYNCKNKDEAETLNNPDQLKEKVQVARIELKAATMLVSLEEEKVQEVVEDEVAVMPSDEHHKDLDIVPEVKSVDEYISAVLLAIGKVGLCGP